MNNLATSINNPNPFSIKPNVYEFPPVQQADYDPDAMLEKIIVDLAVQHYARRLKESPNALGYLQSRGIDDLDMLDEFQVGYVDRTLYQQLYSIHKAKEVQSRHILQKVGLFSEFGHEKYRGCIFTPVFDDAGSLVGVYARRFSIGLRKSKTSYYEVLTSEKTIFFNQKALKESEHIIIVKTPFEAMTLINLGIRNVVSVVGIHSFGAQHVKALEQHNIKRVTLAFDNSKEGNQCMRMIADVLADVCIESYKLPLPKNKDVNEFRMGQCNPKGAIERLLGKAKLCKSSYRSVTEWDYV